MFSCCQKQITTLFFAFFVSGRGGFYGLAFCNGKLSFIVTRERNVREGMFLAAEGYLGGMNDGAN